MGSHDFGTLGAGGRAREVLPLELAYVRDVLDDVARGRGQPLTWPLPDDDGMYPVDMQLLWGGYTEELASATGVGVLILAARRGEDIGATTVLAAMAAATSAPP